MTVFINATSARMGGALTYLDNIVAELDADPREHSITIAVREGIIDAKPTRIAILPIPTPVCDSFVRIFLWQQITLPRILRKGRYDLLYSTANFATFFSPCPQILLIRIPLYFSKLYIRHILSKKSVAHRATFLFRSLLIRFSQRVATHTLFPTDALQRDFFSRKPANEHVTSVNWYGTDPTRFHSKIAVSSPLVRILCTSHYSDYKNYSSLLECLCRLKKEGALRFLCIAPIDPSLPLFKTLPTAKYDLSLMKTLGESLQALGPVPYANVPDLYADADIFVWPSLAESFGHPLIEAMAAGLPVICSDIPVNRELCGNAALYVPPLDPLAWSDTLLKLAQDENLRASLIAAGQNRVSLFQWKDHVDRLNHLFGQYDRHQHSHSNV